MPDSDGEQKMAKVIESFKSELAKIRTGRATPEMLDDVEVEVYESKMPIQHIASVSVPDARTIAIQPWDSSNTEPIEKAIQSSNLGLSPVVDGNIIRVSVPALTEEHRKEMVKDVHRKAEDARIAIRRIRHEMMDDIDKGAEAGGVSEDYVKRQKDAVEKIVSGIMEKLDGIAESKEKDLMTI